MRTLAEMPEGSKLRTADLAIAADVPPGFVPTIVATLHRAGLLECKPGRSGGCELARSPEEISALEIITALEGPLTDKNCVLDGRRCMDEPACELHDAWSTAKDAIVESLDGRTLDQMAKHVPGEERQVNNKARKARAGEAAGSGDAPGGVTDAAEVD